MLRERAVDDSQGFFSFLKTVDKKWTVTYDENDDRAKYRLNHLQDLAWGAADDRSRNWRELDPRRVEGPIPVECRSASCGTCWVGVLGGAEKLTDVAAREGKKIKEFGYIETAESKPLIRLACQAQAQGAVSIVIPPWNGVFGKYLEKIRRIISSKIRGSPLALRSLAAAFLWSTGGLFIKWTTLAGLELSFCRSLFAMITVAILTRHEGFGLNSVYGDRISALCRVTRAVCPRNESHDRSERDLSPIHRAGVLSYLRTADLQREVSFA